MNDTGLHLGKSKQNQEISELKILVGTNVSRQIIWFWGGLAKEVRLEYLTENSFDT
jgi:hypothetical protein